MSKIITNYGESPPLPIESVEMPGGYIQNDIKFDQGETNPRLRITGIRPMEKRFGSWAEAKLFFEAAIKLCDQKMEQG